ncbi:hypothetical protein Tco_1169537 [Tanacetum coccineum]
MLVPQVVEGEGSGQPYEPQPPSSTALPSHEEQVTTVASQPQKTHTPRRAKRGRDTDIPQSSGPLKKFGDEVVYTGEVDRVVRVATTATSLETEQESGNIHKTRSTATLNEPSPQGTGLGSGPKCQDTTLGDADAQTSMEHQDDLKDFVPPTPHDSPLLEGYILGSDEGNFDDDFDDIDDMVNKEMENVGDTINVGGAVNIATIGVSAASTSVTTAGVSISTAESRTPPTTTTTAFENEDLTIAQTLVKMRSEKAKEKGVAVRDVEEYARSIKILPTIDPKDKGKGIMQEREKPPKNPRKAQIQMDEELAIRLQEEEKAELEKMQRERAAQEEAYNAALITEFDDVQARMDADALLAARL